MKTTLIILGAVALFTVGSMATTSFASSEEKHAEGHHEHGEGSHAEGHMGHMGHMNNVLQILKHKLGSKYNQPVAAATEEQLVLGKKVFTKSCVVCHGANGKGDGPAAAAFKRKPADFTDPEHSKYYSDQGRIFVIKNGIDGTPMPAWKDVLNEQEISSVYAYIRSLRIPENESAHGHGMHNH